MIPLRQLSLESPQAAKPGTLLIQNARYDRSPLITCTLNGKAAAFTLAPAAEAGFNVDYVGDGLGRWLSAGDATVLVDVTSTISPSRSDIPWGAVCLIGGEIRFAVRCGHGTGYVGLDGSISDLDNFDDFVAFAKWKLQVKGEDDENFTVYESDLPRITDSK